MEAPHPTVGARERERVRFEIEDTVNFLGEVLLHAGGQGRLGKTVNLEQRSTKGREAFLQPRHIVVEQTQDVAGQQIACRHVLLRLNLYASRFRLVDQTALRMHLNDVKGIVVERVDELVDEGVDVNAIDGQPTGDDELKLVVELHPVLVLSDDAHDQACCTVGGRRDVLHSLVDQTSSKFLQRNLVVHPCKQVVDERSKGVVCCHELHSV